MNKISFVLKRSTSDTPQAIIATLRTGGSRLKLYTGLSVEPKLWNPKRQRVKAQARYAAIYNDRLERIAYDLTEIVLDLMNRHIEPTPERVKTRYEALTIKDASRGERTFLDFVEEWITESKHHKAASTIKNHETLKKQLQSYSEERGATLTFDRMDKEFANSFAAYLSRVVGLQNSSVWKAFKEWKIFMRWAVDKGYTSNRDFETIREASFNVQQRSPVRLTEDELRALAAADLSDEPAQDNARRLFVLQCALGVRYGDLRRITANPSAYRDGDSIRLLTGKNKKQVLIPLLPTARAILEAGELRAFTTPYTNRLLKKAARKAGLSRLVTVSEFRGMQRTDRTVPLSDLLTTHVAKHTFVSLMAASGVPREIIRAVTGNTDATLDRYVHIDEGEIHREMNRAAGLLTPKNGAPKHGAATKDTAPVPDDPPPAAVKPTSVSGNGY